VVVVVVVVVVETLVPSPAVAATMVKPKP